MQIRQNQREGQNDGHNVQDKTFKYSAFNTTRFTFIHLTDNFIQRDLQVEEHVKILSKRSISSGFFLRSVV